MPRIRTIKPEFPQSESMGRVSRDARLLFIMLWTIADDFGRTRAASRMLASLLFPYDDDAVQRIPGWLSELEKENSIRMYEIEEHSYLQILKWEEHQRIDHPSKSKFPSPPEKFAKAREGSRKRRSGPRTKEGTKEGTKDQDQGLERARTCAPNRGATKIPENFPLQSNFEAAQTYWRSKNRDDLCPRTLEIADGFRDHHTAHGTASFDWNASWRTWYHNSLKFEKANGHGNEKKRSTGHDNFLKGALAFAAHPVGDTDDHKG